MSERRMFSRTVLESDRFIDLSAKAKVLYLYLCLSADDDGAVSNPKTVARTVGSTNVDIEDLVDAGFIISFPSGIVVICHWRIHNRIQKDRYKPTLHKNDFALLKLDGNVYRLADNTDTACVRLVSGTDTQDSIGQDRTGEVSADNDLLCGSHTHGETKPYGEFQNVLLTDDELSRLKTDVANYADYIEALSGYMARTGKAYKSHYATIKAWYNKDKKDGKTTTHVKDKDYNVDITEVI